MPVQQLECGDDFCVALMENGIVFSWGDGEEGKLGLGALLTQERPTMVDFLLPAECASGSESSATTHSPHAFSSSSHPAAPPATTGTSRRRSATPIRMRC